MAAVAVWLAFAFNRLVRARNRVREAWGQIDVQLAQRADLVPQLVAAVEGYREHERKTLEDLTAARTAVEQARGPRQAGEADDTLEGALGRVYALAEAYPELKADAAFVDLQLRLVTLEEDIASARRYYNALVERYESTRQTFPTAAVSGALGFDGAEYFKVHGEVRVSPSVEVGE